MYRWTAMDIDIDKRRGKGRGDPVSSTTHYTPAPKYPGMYEQKRQRQAGDIGWNVEHNEFAHAAAKAAGGAPYLSTVQQRTHNRVNGIGLSESESTAKHTFMRLPGQTGSAAFMAIN
mmetsp:Transcript_28407/g.92780  ORF Transcript_28407/g.92780 Transcript_28407/m.92780 type:complete len:117 (-) Transcript_28407:964-1314(-)